MSRKSKKVILFIVEGPTDEDTLSRVLKNIFQEDDVKFHIVHGDLTSDLRVNTNNVIKTIVQHVKNEMNRYGFLKADIQRIVQLVDTDGACVSEDRIREEKNITQIQYKENEILCNNVKQIAERNQRKQMILSRLYKTSNVWSIPYEIYYFSRNLEHVLHNVAEDLTDDEKVEYADLFVDTYGDCPQKFIEFLSESDFTVKSDYIDSWHFIFDGAHSLQRHCNLHILFEGN